MDAHDRQVIDNVANAITETGRAESSAIVQAGNAQAQAMSGLKETIKHGSACQTAAIKELAMAVNRLANNIVLAASVGGPVAQASQTDRKEAIRYAAEACNDFDRMVIPIGE